MGGFNFTGPNYVIKYVKGEICCKCMQSVNINIPLEMETEILKYKKTINAEDLHKIVNKYFGNKYADAHFGAQDTVKFSVTSNFT